MAGIETFVAQARDKGDTEWTTMGDPGSPQLARTKMVAEAGFMATQGYMVKGFNRNSITVERDGKQTQFRIHKVSDRCVNVEHTALPHAYGESCEYTGKTDMGVA